MPTPPIRCAAACLLALTAAACGANRSSDLQWPPQPPAKADTYPRRDTPDTLLGGRRHTFVLRVVDRDTGQPVVNAEVLYLPAHLDDARLSFAERDLADYLWSADAERYFSRYGAAVRTDGVGKVELRLAENNRRFFARKGDLRGDLYVFEALPFADRTSEHVLRLERPVAVDATVVDAAGRPQVGVRVDVTFGTSGHARSYRAEGPDARVRIVKPFGLDDDENWHELTITPFVFGAEAKVARVDMRAPGAQPVRVECPPNGRMLVDAPPASRGGSYGNYLALAHASRDWRDPGMFAAGVLLPDGRFLFPSVALGQRFEPLRLGPAMFPYQSSALPGGFARQTVEGPREAGQTAHVKLSADDRAPVLTASLVDGEGRAHANRRVHVVMELRTEQRGYGKLFHAETDGDGRLHLRLPRYLGDLEVTDLVIHIVDARGEPVGPTARIPPPDFQKAPRAELGEVVLTRPPRLVTLDLRRQDGTAAMAGHNIEVARDPAADPVTWVAARPELREVRADGSTVYFTHDRATRWRVTFFDPAFGERDPNPFAAPVEFVPGGDPVKVVAARRYR